MAKKLFTARQDDVVGLKNAGMTKREIAAELSKREGRTVTVDAVKQRLTRARKRVAKRYAKSLSRALPGSSGGARPHKIVPLQLGSQIRIG